MLQYLHELTGPQLLESVPRKETCLVSLQVGCARALLDTNSFCATTKQFDPAFRQRVVDEQEFELVQSSFLFNVVQIVSFP